MCFKVCGIHISKYGLKGKDTETNYGPVWFNIKCSPSYIDRPRHVFRQMQLLKSLEPKVQHIVRSVLSRFISVNVIRNN